VSGRCGIVCSSGTITILGTNFGNPSIGHVKPHLSDVLFYDIDLGYFPAGELEYISWTDNKIVVEVPTMRKIGSAESPGACTGKIGIFKTDFNTGDTCTVYSTKKIYVRFGLFNSPWQKKILNWEVSQGNFIDKDIYGGQRQNLVNANGLGGYTIDLKTLYPNDPAKNAIAFDQTMKALDVYRCVYKINVKISSTSPNGVIKRSLLQTGILGTTMMFGSSTPASCDASTDVDANIGLFNVFINQKILDGYNEPGYGTYKFNLLDGVPTDTNTINYTDFQRTLLHELGHCFQLRHTNNQGDIMAPGYVFPPLFNNFSRELSKNDKLGIEHLYLLSKLGSCGINGMTDYVCTNATENYESQKNNCLIFPNPTTGKITVKNYIEWNPCKIQVFTFDGKIVKNYFHFFEGNNLEIQLLPTVPNGMYGLLITDENGKCITFNKFVIER
jgi:Secretion system C-terminal sorting domain/Matrixin